MLGHIVGFEMEIDTLVGKYKLGQNRTPQDQNGIMTGLATRPNAGGPGPARLHASAKSQMMKRIDRR